MTKIKMHIFKVKLPFYPLCEVKCGLQNRVLTLIIPKAIFMWIGIIGKDTLYEFVIMLLILNRDESKGTILYKGCLSIYFLDGLYII